MKLVSTDNFNRENMSESLIAENVSEYWAEKIAKLLNDKYSGDQSPFYCVVKPDDYQLYEFEP